MDKKNADILQAIQQKRVNYLLESCLLNEMAKQSMKEYKKTTAKNFSKSNREARYEKH